MNKTANVLIIDGGTVKTDDNGVVEGLGIVFGSESEPDSSSERDFFTPDSFVRKRESFSIPLYYNHGLGPIKTEIGEATLTKEDGGWRAVANLDLSDELGKAVFEAVKEKPHGFSTGALQHLVQREAKDNGTNFLKRWVVGEISLTERPAERKAVVESIKSINDEIVTEPAWDEEPKEDEVKETKEEPKLFGIYNDKGEKIWDVDEAVFGKFVEVAGDTKCGEGGYSYVSVSNDGASISVSPDDDGDIDISGLIANLQNAITMLQTLAPLDTDAGMDGNKAMEARLSKKIDALVQGDSKKFNELQAALTEKENAVADLTSQLSAASESLTQANKEIAQLKILAGAKETIKNAKV